MSASDYFVTPGDIGRSVQRIRMEHGIGIILGLVAAFLVYKFTGLGAETAIFAALLIALMVWRSDPRWLFGAAIGSFGAIIVVSTMWREVEIFNKPLSERMAVWSFYFLVIGVMLLIVESYWPKDGTFNALQQKAPSAAKDKYRHLPQHIKTKLKHQREERAAAEAAATAKAKNAPPEGGFKHPLFANGQPPLQQADANGTNRQSGSAAKKARAGKPAEKPFQYIAQTPPKLRQPEPPRELPVPPAQARPLAPVKPVVSQLRPAAAQPQAAAAATAQPTRTKPPLLDLRSAPRTAPASKAAIKVAETSNSPLPSKRRKLVQL